MCGALRQWSRDPGGSAATGASWAVAYDGNDTDTGGGAVKGKHYMAPYRAILGGEWSLGTSCGSRNSYWNNTPLLAWNAASGRGVSEAAANRL